MEVAQQSVLKMENSEEGWKRFYRFSGILLILGLFTSFYVAYLGRILYLPGYPADPEAYLQFISGRQGLAALTWAIWIVGDLLAVVPTLAMYFILRPFGRVLASLGSLIVIIYIIYDFSVTELTSLTLVNLGHAYASATSQAVRASLIGAASFGYYALPLQTVLSFAIGSLGWMLWCIPMARSFFGRWTAIFGIVVNVIGLLGAVYPVIPSSFFLGLCQFLCIRLIAIWLSIIGVQILLHFRPSPKNESNNLQEAL
jgi:hypothetical protein